MTGSYLLIHMCILVGYVSDNIHSSTLASVSVGWSAGGVYPSMPQNESRETHRIGGKAEYNYIIMRIKQYYLSVVMQIYHIMPPYTQSS